MISLSSVFLCLSLLLMANNFDPILGMQLYPTLTALTNNTVCLLVNILHVLNK